MAARRELVDANVPNYNVRTCVSVETVVKTVQNVQLKKLTSSLRANFGLTLPALYHYILFCVSLLLHYVT